MDDCFIYSGCRAGHRGTAFQKTAHGPAAGIWGRTGDTGVGPDVWNGPREFLAVFLCIWDRLAVGICVCQDGEGKLYHRPSYDL